MDAWSVLKALWLFLPAYVANMSPVFTSKMFPKWSHPIDGGRLAKDGKRLLGDGKTWRGLFGGGLFAAATAVAVAAIAAPAGSGGVFAGWDYGAHGFVTAPAPPCNGDDADCLGPETGFSSYLAIALFGFIVGFVALLGDAVESYFKRRSGRERGTAWIPFDQLDFVVFGLLGMLAASPLLVEGWIIEMVFKDWVVLATLLIGTVGLHLLVNRIGYWLKLKEVPW